jgi:hypothetical protein
VLAVAATVYTRLSGINPQFPWSQILDIALAAMDFGSGVLFVVEAFEVGRDPDMQAARTFGHASFIFLLVASGVSFVSYLLLLRHYSSRPNSIDNIDWHKIGKHAGWYGVLSLLTSADIELIKLLPWKKETKTFDGFPDMQVAILLTCMTLLEDVPQFICQMIFVVTITQTYTAYGGVNMLACCKAQLKAHGGGAHERHSQDSSGRDGCSCGPVSSNDGRAGGGRLSCLTGDPGSRTAISCYPLSPSPRRSAYVCKVHVRLCMGKGGAVKCGN